MSFLNLPKVLLNARFCAHLRVIVYTFAAVIFSQIGFGQCVSTIAYTGTSATGNQSYSERLGLNFTNSSTIVVNQLWAYDSGQDGLNLPIQVAIYNTTTNALVAGPVTFTGSSDPLDGFYRTRAITPVSLPAGSYVVVATGYGSAEQNGNNNIPVYPNVTTNSGGVLTFPNSSFGGVGIGVPTTPFANAAVFHAGSFSFYTDIVAPEVICPSNIVMNTDDDQCTAVVCYNIDVTDNCGFSVPRTLAGYTYLGSFNGHEYFASTATSTWDAANAAAVTAGGYLAAINSSAEQAFLSSLLPDGITSQYYIGYRYSSALNANKWTSGETTAYTNIAPGQPAVVVGDVVYHINENLPSIGGWYNGLPTESRLHILELENGLPTLVSGPSSGSIFNQGLTEITYSVTDAAGNTDECTFSVTVEDNQDPVLTCQDDIVINLDAGECSRAVSYTTPVATDNCTGVGTPSLIDGPASTSELAVGIHTVTYMVSDAASNTTTCSFTITINDRRAPSLACQPLQLSLNEDCEGELLPSMALTGYLDAAGNLLIGCPTNFIIDIKDKNGLSLGNTASIAQIGQTLNYTITNAYGYSCWNTVTIKDKMAPTINCTSFDVNCLANLDVLGTPTFDDNCSATTTVKKISEIFDNNFSCDANYIGTLTRQWVALDASGNSSDTCTSVLSLRRPSVTGVTAAADATFECDEVLDLDANGNPTPGEAGIPTLAGEALYPTSALEMKFCNATIEYKDQIVTNTACKKIIVRTWRILEWWCGTLVEHFIDEQRISILDTKGPVLGTVADLSFSTGSQSCTGMAVLPALSVTDRCNTVPKFSVAIMNGATLVKSLNTNGGTTELPTGQYSVTYTATDACLNQSTRTFKLSIADNTDPLAICAQFNTVSVNTTGYTDVTAQSIGSGSSDECTAVTLKIRRTTDPCGGGFDTAWYDRVEFCCLDAGTRPMIQLLVSDAGGNTNMCMVSVQVQDSQHPRISCPNDTLITNCSYVFDANNASTVFGSAKVIDNCPANTTIIETVADGRTNCGTGKVVRTFTLNPLPTSNGTCQQTITFENNDPFFINRINPLDTNDDIIWPKDFVTTSTCLLSALAPGSLPDSSARPRVVEGKCDLVGMSVKDRPSSPTTNGACFSILRTWAIIDWCQKDSNGDPVIWEYEQELTVIDRNPPVFDANTQAKTISIVDCGQARVSFTARATDCTPANELVYRYQITQGSTVLKNGEGRVALDTLPVGIYSVEFTASDRCGNISNQKFDFTVVSTKAPIAICRNITVNLVNNTAEISRTISVSDIDVKSNHECGYPVALSFSSTASVLTRTFRCPDRNTVITVPLYVTASNGTINHCNAMVSVQDSNKLCPNFITSNIAGRLATFDNKVLKDAIIELQSEESKLTESNINGQYSFTEIINGNNYKVIPRCDNDVLNGVSTLDLVTIQRHVLGIQKITNPYLLIAADIDHNDKINSSDLVHLRKVILGSTASFADNTSWRFVDKDFNFIDSANPWMSPIKETYLITSLQNDMNIDFVGVKIGDVNGSFNGVNGDVVAKRSTINLDAEDRNLNIGDEVVIPFVINNDSELLGLQMRFNTKNLEILDINSDVMLSSNESISNNNGQFSISLFNATESDLSSGKTLFTLRVKATRSGKLSDMLSIADDQFTEYYNNIEESSEIRISWTEKVSTFKLLNAAPNPWTTSTTIGYIVPAAGEATLKIYDFSGKEYFFKSMDCKEGENQFIVSKSEMNRSGVYIYEVEYNGQKVTGKMILME